MATNVQSDQFELKHPKPPFSTERKLVSGAWVDWDTTTEVNAAVPVAYRKNKYFWIAGTYMQCDNDGTTYRPTAGIGNTAWKFLKLAVNADGSGVPDQTFDGYIAAGYIISHESLENVKIGQVTINGIIFQDFVPTANNYLSYDSIPGLGTLTLSMNDGPTTNPGWVVIAYQNL